MITLYDPKTQTFRAFNGKDVQDPILLLLNQLIEMRAMNQIALDQQGGIAVQTLEIYRSDVVNDAQNPKF